MYAGARAEAASAHAGKRVCRGTARHDLRGASQAGGGCSPVSRDAHLVQHWGLGAGGMGG